MVEMIILDGDRALEHKDALKLLYAEVYAEPPYYENEQYAERFGEHFAKEIALPGFSLVVASNDQLLVGAAYGWTMAAGRWFKNSTSPAPQEIESVPKFAIMEWMVHRDCRKLGIGKQLLQLILQKRHEPFAVLASNPASTARRIYTQMGWMQCGTTSGGVMPPMDLLFLKLGSP